MFKSSTSSGNPQSKKRYATALALAVPIYMFIVTTIIIVPLFTKNELPTIYKEVSYVIKASLEPPIPPAPPPVAQPPTGGSKSDTPNTDTVPTSAPDKVAPKPGELPRWSPIPTCTTCIPDLNWSNKPWVIGKALALPIPETPSKEPLRISLSQAPKQLIRINPIYPTIAQSARVEGVVVIEATIDTRGYVINSTILSGQALLNEAALTAVRQWKYEPHKLNGKPIPVIMTVRVTFTLR